nr:hypothetical protein [Scytonema hofmannii]
MTNWNQIRATYPNRPLKLYGAGKDSGTYDYFNEAIVGNKSNSCSDYTGSEDDNRWDKQRSKCTWLYSFCLL